MFQKIDWFFLSPFEKWCHFLQKMTGKTNFYYGGLCSFLIVLIYLGVYFNIFPEELAGKNNIVFDRTHPMSLWLGVFLFALYSLLLWKIHETWVYTQLNNGTANNLKVMHSGRLVRNLFVMILPFVLLSPEFQIYDKSFIVLLVLFIFFVSYDPLPPCKGKVKEWLKSFGKKSTLVPIKTEE